MNKISQAQQIRQFIINRTPNNWDSGSKFIGAADRDFWVPRRQDIRGILSKTPIGHHGQQGEIYDCDEYACTLKSRLGFLALTPEARARTDGHPIAAGIFWGRVSWSNDPLHAGNWFVTRENDLVWIEPQFNNQPAQNNGNDPIRGSSDSVSHLRLMLF